MRIRILVILLAFFGTVIISQIKAAAHLPVTQASRSSNLAVNIRRDISNGLPYGSAHSAGISQIIWGYASPSSALTIILKRGSSTVSVRTARVNPDSSFSISSDRFIEDGDTVLLSDGISAKTVEVPAA